MITVRVWWWAPGGDTGGVDGVELPVLPRKHDVLDLEHLDDERFAHHGGCFELDAEGKHVVADVGHLVVREVKIGAQIDVQVSCPRDRLCPYCGKEVDL